MLEDTSNWTESFNCSSIPLLSHLCLTKLSPQSGQSHNPSLDTTRIYIWHGQIHLRLLLPSNGSNNVSIHQSRMWLGLPNIQTPLLHCHEDKSELKITYAVLQHRKCLQMVEYASYNCDNFIRWKDTDRTPLLGSCLCQQSLNLWKNSQYMQKMTLTTSMHLARTMITINPIP